jgi:hypothetical protein
MHGGSIYILDCLLKNVIREEIFMKNKLIIKSSVIGVIFLFFGASIVQSVNSEVETSYNVMKIENLNYGAETFYPTDDSEIAQDQPNTYQGHIPMIIIRNEYGSGGSSGFASQGLVKFDLSSVSDEAIVISATFYLYYYDWSSTNPAGRPINIYRITSDWKEDTVTWNTQPTYHSSPTDNCPIPQSVGMWMNWDVKSDVQDFVSGQVTNYGWIIIDNNYWGMSNIPLALVRTKEHSQELSPYLEIIVNEPPSAPLITGPTTGKNREGYDYTFIAFDPDDDDIHLWIEWGDESVIEWLGPYESGEQVTISHTWTEKGSYTIKAKAKDTYNIESEWAELTVTMPKNKSFTFNFPLLSELFERFPNAFPILKYLLGL